MTRLSLTVIDRRNQLATSLSGQPPKDVPLCAFDDIDMAPPLAAAILRAAANEIDPPPDNYEVKYEGDVR